MRAGVLVVTLALVLSGCNGVVGGPDGGPERTLTPAPVPSETRADSVRPGTPDCVGPPPATPGPSRGSPTATPDTTWPAPPSGEVDGSRLIEAHNAALRNHSYHLRAGDSIEVWSLPDAAAFSYQGVYVNRFVSVYAVNGTLYSVAMGVGTEADRGDITRKPYPPGNESVDVIDPVVGVSFWLWRLVAPYDYTYEGTRGWNGSTVRVYRGSVDGPLYVRLRQVVTLNSTIYVDRRGIIRRIDHREEHRPARSANAPTNWRNETLVVTGIGADRIRRPSAFCGVVGRVPE